MSIPLLDLQSQYASIKEEIQEAVYSVLESQHFIMGDFVKHFEKEVADYCETEFAYGCASGSDALLLALMAIDLQPGDYVLTSPFTFFATAGAIHRLGGIPVFIDIEKDSFNLNPKKVRDFLEGTDELSKRINPDPKKIKAIIPVHLYGQMADMDPIMDLAKEFDLKVIEDAAQSIGSVYKGVQAGNYGDFGCFSFFPSKNLGAFGDAGLITVKDEGLAEKVDILRLHGARPKYHHKYVGINSRLDSIQAAVLSIKLRYLDQWSNERARIAKLYNHYFEEAGVVADSSSFCSDNCAAQGEGQCELDRNKIILPKETTGNVEEGGRHIYHQYTIRSSKRNELVEALNAERIGSSVYYPVPLHVQECFSDLQYKAEDCPISMCTSRQALSLPIYPELTEEQVKKVVHTIAKALH
ncbi:MAG: DegT/DnrJ/EryC1/StrS family aminotransferase [Balneola sp.]